MLITGAWTIPYVILVYTGWVMFNSCWANDNSSKEISEIGLALGFVWAVFILIAGWNYNPGLHETNTSAYLCEYIPLVLLILFSATTVFDFLSEHGMIDSIIYLIPVLLTLTLFFL